MMDVEASYSDFINCDRTGRRNAVPDITSEGEQVPASTSELAKDLAEMELQAAGETPSRPPNAQLSCACSAVSPQNKRAKVCKQSSSQAWMV